MMLMNSPPFCLQLNDNNTEKRNYVNKNQSKFTLKRTQFPDNAFGMSESSVTALTLFSLCTFSYEGTHFHP